MVESASIRSKIEQRLKNLQTEFESGQKMMTNLKEQQQNLTDTMLRISGAIQTLEELLSEIDDANELKG